MSRSFRRIVIPIDTRSCCIALTASRCRRSRWISSSGFPIPISVRQREAHGTGKIITVDLFSTVHARVLVELDEGTDGSEITGVFFQETGIHGVARLSGVVGADDVRNVRNVSPNGAFRRVLLALPIDEDLGMILSHAGLNPERPRTLHCARSGLSLDICNRRRWRPQTDAIIPRSSLHRSAPFVAHDPFFYCTQAPSERTVPSLPHRPEEPSS